MFKIILNKKIETNFNNYSILEDSYSIKFLIKYLLRYCLYSHQTNDNIVIVYRSLEVVVIETFAACTDGYRYLFKTLCTVTQLKFI